MQPLRSNAITVKTKPLSVNTAWQGKRFKSRDYKMYEVELFRLLPTNIVVPEGFLEIHYIFGFSNKLSDYDNPVKPLQDILQKKYNFSDARIYRAVIDKIIVPKGSEFLMFEITPYVPISPQSYL